jgi:pimeloyl-ACP methyl ester carboxylesterase
MPQASLAIIPGSGHMPNLEDPSRFNRHLLDHLSACGC